MGIQPTKTASPKGAQCGPPTMLHGSVSKLDAASNSAVQNIVSDINSSVDRHIIQHTSMTQSTRTITRTSTETNTTSRASNFTSIDHSDANGLTVTHASVDPNGHNHAP